MSSVPAMFPPLPARSPKAYTKADKRRVLGVLEAVRAGHPIQDRAEALSARLRPALHPHWQRIVAPELELELEPCAVVARLFDRARVEISAAWEPSPPSFSALDRVAKAVLYDPLVEVEAYFGLLESLDFRPAALQPLLERLVGDRRGRVIARRLLESARGMDYRAAEAPTIEQVLENPGLIHDVVRAAELRERRRVVQAQAGMSEQCQAWRVIARLPTRAFRTLPALQDALPGSTRVAFASGSADEDVRVEIHDLGVFGPYVGPWARSQPDALRGLQKVARQVVDLPVQDMTPADWGLRVSGLRAQGVSGVAWWECAPDLGRLPAVAQRAGLGRVARWMKANQSTLGQVLSGVPRHRVCFDTGWTTLVDHSEPVGPNDLTRLDVGPMLLSELLARSRNSSVVPERRSRPMVLVAPSGPLVFIGVPEPEVGPHDRLIEVEIAYLHGADKARLVFDPHRGCWADEVDVASGPPGQEVRVRGEGGRLVLHDLRSPGCRRLAPVDGPLVLDDAELSRCRAGEPLARGTIADGGESCGMWRVALRGTDMLVEEDQSEAGRLRLTPKAGWATRAAIAPSPRFRRLELGPCASVSLAREGHCAARLVLIEAGVDGWSSLALPYDPRDLSPNPLVRTDDRSVALLPIKVAAQRYQHSFDPVFLLGDHASPDDGPPVIREAAGRMVVVSGRARALALLGAPESQYRRYLDAVEQNHGLARLRPEERAGSRWLVVRMLAETKHQPRCAPALDWWHPVSAHRLAEFMDANPHVAEPGDGADEHARTDSIVQSLVESCGLGVALRRLERRLEVAVEGALPGLVSLHALVNQGALHPRYDLLPRLGDAVKLLVAATEHDRGFSSVLAEIDRDWRHLRLPAAGLRLSDTSHLAVTLASVLYAAGRTSRSALEAAQQIRSYAEEARRGVQAPGAILAALAAPLAVPSWPRPSRAPWAWRAPHGFAPKRSPMPDASKPLKSIKAALTAQQKKQFELIARKEGLTIGAAARTAVHHWTDQVLGGIEPRVPAAEIGKAAVRRFPKQVTVRLCETEFHRFQLAVAVAESSATHCARCAVLRWHPPAPR